jgi:hypothetical protein
MQIFQFRQSLITGLFILTGYFSSNGQTIFNLEPELPAPIAALAQQPGLKSWYNKSAKTWCCIYNDHNAVYIQLSMTDRLQQKKVVENGIELWVDVKGKRKKNTGIKFPLPAGVQNAKHPSGLQVSLAYDHDTLIYQATIPFQALGRSVSMPADMNIGIVAKGLLPAGFIGMEMPVPDEPMGEGIMQPQSPPPADTFSAEENAKQFRKNDIVWYRFTVRR